MGYGGNLIWTSVFATLANRGYDDVRVCEMPLLTDLLAGRFYRGDITINRDAILRDNPHISFPKRIEKKPIAQSIDRAFERVLGAFGLRHYFERRIHAAAIDQHRRTGILWVHLDLRLYSYGAKVLKDRIVWTSDSRAADSILHCFTNGKASQRCELFVTENDRQKCDALIASHDLNHPFIAIEPDTNRDYFGTLRQWPLNYWQELVNAIKAARPDVTVVQIGLKNAQRVSGTLDLRGQTDFRTAALLLGRSDLFIGTESGLMHAANAVDARALILWGGITLPEYIGYPDQQTTICKYVSCAPCGRRGDCHNGHICMRSISVDEVFEAALSMLPCQTTT